MQKVTRRILKGTFYRLMERKGISDNVDINLYFVNFSTEGYYSVALPISLYRSEDNFFGVKLTPIAESIEFSGVNLKSLSVRCGLSSSLFIRPQVALFSGFSIPLYYSDNNLYYDVVGESTELFGYGGINFRRVFAKSMGFSAYVYNSKFNVELDLNYLIRMGYNITDSSIYIDFWGFAF